MKDRERWFNVVMGEKLELDERTTERLAERVPLPAEAAAREIALRLEVVRYAEALELQKMAEDAGPARVARRSDALLRLGARLRASPGRFGSQSDSALIRPGTQGLRSRDRLNT